MISWAKIKKWPMENWLLALLMLAFVPIVIYLVILAQAGDFTQTRLLNRLFDEQIPLGFEVIKKYEYVSTWQELTYGAYYRFKCPKKKFEQSLSRLDCQKYTLDMIVSRKDAGRYNLMVAADKGWPIPSNVLEADDLDDMYNPEGKPLYIYGIKTKGFRGAVYPAITILKEDPHSVEGVISTIPLQFW